jgi:hypothetical protein
VSIYSNTCKEKPNPIVLSWKVSLLQGTSPCRFYCICFYLFVTVVEPGEVGGGFDGATSIQLEDGTTAFFQPTSKGILLPVISRGCRTHYAGDPHWYTIPQLNLTSIPLHTIKMAYRTIILCNTCIRIPLIHLPVMHFEQL